MFSFYSVILDLIKARTHKYIRRIPVGATKTGATKYRYFYQGQEGHGQGIAHESELVVGASFAFGEGGNKYHAHITKVDGSNIIIEYDDGAKKGTQETISKQDFQKRVHAEHKDAIKIAHEKSKAQFARVEQMKEGGAKVQQKTLDKWSTQVNKLKDIADLFDKPAEIDSPWMTAKEKRVFEGQNRLFKMLENKELTLELLKNHTNKVVVGDMFRNIITAIFKYKDLSRISAEQKQVLASIMKLSFSNTYSNFQYYALLSPISALWQNLPFIQETKDTQVKRLHVIQDDSEKMVKEEDIKRIRLDAVEKAQNALLNVDSDLSKIIYGNIIFTQINKFVDRELAGFYVPGVSMQEKQHITTTLETVHHSADVVYINSDTPYNTPTVRKIIPQNTLQNLKTRYYEDVVKHELSHRFTRSLTEQGNTEFRKDISDFYKKYAKGETGTRDMNTIVNRPVKEFTKAPEATATILNEIIASSSYNVNTGEFTGFIRNGDNTPLGRKTIKVQDIDFEALGNTTIEANDQEGIYSLLVPLLNGNILKVRTKHLNVKQVYAAFNRSMSYLPTEYASQNEDEMFSEMMSAVCDPDYKDEPMRAEFLALIKKHKQSFGA